MTVLEEDALLERLGITQDELTEDIIRRTVLWLEPRFDGDRSFDGRGKRLLNIGCGRRPFKGFDNLDSLVIPGIEFPGQDARSLTMISDSAYDYVYACHVLEHVPRNETFSTLVSWNRVLRVGGMLRIAVPNWDATVNYYQQTGDLENCLNWIYGGREREELNEFTHRRIFNFSNLRALLYEAGFKRIELYEPERTFHGNLDDFSFARRPHMDPDGIAMSLNVQAVK